MAKPELTLTASDIRWLQFACSRAIQWEESLLDANIHIPKTAVACQQNIRRFKQLREKLRGQHA